MKKSKIITIRVSEEVAALVEYNAREERRTVGELVSLWVEDVARVETLKKTDKGTTWQRPQFTRDKTLWKEWKPMKKTTFANCVYFLGDTWQIYEYNDFESMQKGYEQLRQSYAIAIDGVWREIDRVQFNIFG